MPSDPDPAAPPDEPPGIEVGATEGGLRYWLAKEALRQGEARLNAQNGIRTALEARATAITGWAAVGFLAAVGAGFSTSAAPRFFGAVTASSLLFVAGAIGIAAARPRGWSVVGYEPDLVLAMGERFGTELEALEAIAGGVADGVVVNNVRIAKTARLLRWAGWLLILAPLVGGGAYKATSTACGYPIPAAWLASLADCPRPP